MFLAHYNTLKNTAIILRKMRYRLDHVASLSWTEVSEQILQVVDREGLGWGVLEELGDNQVFFESQQ